MIDPNHFKIRCSRIAEIMTNGRNGSDLSETAKTYCKQWIISQLYNRNKEIDSKYLEKGTINESDAMTIIERLYSLPFIIKNDQYFDSIHMCGTPDIIYGNTVRDIKCSWDAFTFPYFDETPDKRYYWQLQGYMYLTGTTEAYLDYVLTNTPDHLVDSIITRESFSYNGMTEERENEIRQYHYYDDLPDELRVKTFHIHKDETAFINIINRVEQCREYITSLLKHIQ